MLGSRFIIERTNSASEKGRICKSWCLLFFHHFEYDIRVMRCLRHDMEKLIENANTSLIKNRKSYSRDMGSSKLNTNRKLSISKINYTRMIYGRRG